MFTYRDFEMGTLGLAWTGDLKNAGGVCEKNGVRQIIDSIYKNTKLKLSIALSRIIKIIKHGHCDVIKLWKTRSTRSVACHSCTRGMSV